MNMEKLDIIVSVFWDYRKNYSNDLLHFAYARIDIDVVWTRQKPQAQANSLSTSIRKTAVYLFIMAIDVTEK